MRQSIFITVLLIFSAINSFASNKIDPFLNSQINSQKNYKAISNSKSDDYQKEQIENRDVNVFISSNDTDLTEEKVVELGGKITLKLKSILVAKLPMSSVEKISSNQEINYIEAGYPITPKNDSATFDINSIDVNNGASLPSKFNGKNIIIGIIDTGIDYLNPAFKNEDGKSRIISIWDQTKSGSAPSEISGSYGHECNAESIKEETCSITDREGHGTHVAGIASGRDEKYPGVAPESEIIAVVYKSQIEIEDGIINPVFSTTICEAVYYVFAKANKLGKPAVVNLSLGTHIGPHDGTSLFERCLEEIVADSTGRAIVAAAGNEYSDSENFASIYAGGKINGQAYMPFEIRQPSYSSLFYLDMWCTGDDLTFNVGKKFDNDVITDESFNVPLGEQRSGKLLKNLGEIIIDARETKNPNNGKSHIGIMIYPDEERIKDITLLLSIKGNGKCDGWWYPDKPSNAVSFISRGLDSIGNMIYGSNENTITSPATSPAVIAVGAYTTKTKWENESESYGVPYNVGDIMSYSSSGPTANPEKTGIKPDITAPGGMIVSTKSRNSNFPSYLVVDDNHVVMAGTSMASPFVAGTIALMLEAEGNLTNSEIKEYLLATASEDEFTGKVPNHRWGHGKLNSWEAIALTLNKGGTGSFDANSALHNPSEGVMSCDMSSNANNTVILYFIMIALASLSLRKKIQ